MVFGLRGLVTSDNIKRMRAAFGFVGARLLHQGGENGTPHRTEYEFKMRLQMRVEFAKMRVQFANINTSSF